MKHHISKLFIGVIACCTLFGGTAYAQTTNPMKTNTHTLVAYFSATGTTKAVAERIAAIAGADLCEIAPATPYTSADLDWRNDRSRSSVEMADKASRPEMKPVKIDMQAYDTVYIGFPVWWDLAPRIINTFIETVSLQGKTIIPFATSGSSAITNSVRDLQHTYPDLNIRQGKLLNNPSDATLHQWLRK